MGASFMIGEYITPNEIHIGEEALLQRRERLRFHREGRATAIGPGHADAVELR